MLNDNNRKQEGKFEFSRDSSIITLFHSQRYMNKNTLISFGLIVITVIAGILLFVFKQNEILSKKDTASSGSAVLLKFTEKNYKLESKNYGKDAAILVSSFEKNENWQGQADFDDSFVWDGATSLILTSKDNEKAEGYLEKKLDLNKYTIFKIAVYLQSDPVDKELVRLYFGNKDKSAYFAYPLGNLVKGWNFIAIPKIKFSSVNATRENLAKSVKKEATSTVNSKETGLLNWDKIERVGLEALSRPNSTITLNFDQLIALQSDDYLDDWLTLNPLFLDLIPSDNGYPILLAKNIGASTALIKKLSGVSNFVYKAKLQPKKKGARSGLFIKGNYQNNAGYYFMIDGVGGNRWQVIKISMIDNSLSTVNLKNGTINNFIIEEDKPLWLKTESNGDNMKFYLSTDGKSYTKLAEVNDSEYKEGGVGIAVYDSGYTIFDNFEFSQ